jgi:acetamidase/formamidase
MAVGLAGSLDDAMRSATAGLVEWLEQDYGLSVSEAAQVLGTSAEYVVSEVADRNASIVGKLRKDRLAGLTPLKK